MTERRRGSGRERGREREGQEREKDGGRESQKNRPETNTGSWMLLQWLLFSWFGQLTLLFVLRGVVWEDVVRKKVHQGLSTVPGLAFTVHTNLGEGNWHMIILPLIH